MLRLILYEWNEGVIDLATVLCTNGVTSKALAVVRSLGARGVRVITADKHAWHTGSFSKYCSTSLVYPDPVAQKAQFVDWLAATCKRERVDIVYVMDDDTMAAVMDERAMLESISKLTLPPKESYRIAADKGLTARLAQDIGVPCPLTVEPEFGADVEQDKLAAMIAPLKYPLTIKPRNSSGSRGIRFAYDEQELYEQYTAIHKQYPNPVLQEYIPLGAKFDVCVCYDQKGTRLASFVQREVRNFPADRGPATVLESVVYPELEAYAHKLMDRLAWVGVADVEFMIDPRTGIPKLMEINPRFWSSLHLAVRSGVDFPWLVYQSMMGDSVGPVTVYRLGTMARALLPGDILHYLSNSDRKHMDPPFWTVGLPDDIISRTDPWPTFGFFLSALRYSLNPKAVWHLLISR